MGIESDFHGIVSSLSDSEGRSFLRVPADAPLQNVYAFKSGLGLDYMSFPGKERAQTGDLPQPPDLSRAIELTLAGVTTVSLRLLDPKGQPIEGVVVYPWYFKKPTWRDDLNIGGVQDFSKTTDADGTVTFDWIPVWYDQPITFWHRAVDTWTPTRITYDLHKEHGKMIVVLQHTVPIRGQVRYSDGRPAAGIEVKASGAGFQFDGFRKDMQTDERGRFEFHADPDQIYLIVVNDPKWAAPPRDGIVVRPDMPVNGIDFQLQPATLIHGQVTIGPANKPLKWSVSLYQYGADENSMPADKKLPNPAHSNLYVQPLVVRWVTTDADGRYEFHVGPGKYDLRGPSAAAIEKFDITDQKELMFNFHTPRPERGPVAGRVVTEETPPQPVPGAQVTGVPRGGAGHAGLEVTTDSNGDFRTERWLDKMTVYARSKDGTLAGVVEISEDAEQITIPVSRLASAKGRLIDAESGQPLADRNIGYGIRIYDNGRFGPFRDSFGGSVKTDAEGRFSLRGLVVGQEYSLSVPLHKETDPESQHRWQTVGTVTAKAAETVDLGDVLLKPYHPYHPPTVDERIAAAFGKKEPLEEQLKGILSDARRNRQRVLVVFADPAGEGCRQLYRLYYEDRKVQAAFADYRLLSVNSVNKKKNADWEQFAGRFGVTSPGEKWPVLCILDDDGRLLAANKTEDLTKDGQIDTALLVGFIKPFAPKPLDAEKLLADGLSRAGREDKRVFLVESGAYCAPCVVLGRFLDEHRQVLDKDYVFVTIDRSRWQHGSDVMKRLRVDKDQGIPWFVILDANGKRLVTSDAPEGNIGFPSTPAGVEYFLKMLTTTAQRLSQEDQAILRKALQETARH